MLPSDPCGQRWRGGRVSSNLADAQHTPRKRIWRCLRLWPKRRRDGNEARGNDHKFFCGCCFWREIFVYSLCSYLSLNQSIKSEKVKSAFNALAFACLVFKAESLRTWATTPIIQRLSFESLSAPCARAKLNYLRLSSVPVKRWVLLATFDERRLCLKKLSSYRRMQIRSRRLLAGKSFQKD